MFMVIALRFMAVDVAKAFTTVIENWPPLACASAVIVALPLKVEHQEHSDFGHSPEVHTEEYELSVRFLKSRLPADEMSDPSSVEARTWSAAHYWTNYLTILCPDAKHTA
jgi:hypothetical protein